MTNNPNTQIIDVGAITIWIASFAQILPHIAALLSVLWFAIRVVETQTVQQMLGRYAWIKQEKKHDDED